MKTKKMSNPTAPAPVLEIDSITINFGINYRDTSDPSNIQQGHYPESVSINLQNEGELNRLLIEKPYLLSIAPILTSRLLSGYDPENKTAKQLKNAVTATVAPQD